MAGKPRSSARLRTTLDRVLVHDVKNVSFRLRLLLSNLDEHWDDPQFRETVKELLASTVERLEQAVGRLSTDEDAVLIKVSLDVNGLIHEVVARPPRRQRPGARAAPARLALGQVPRIWGDPFYLGDAFASLLENAAEAAGPDGRVLVRTFATGSGRRARVVVEVIDNGSGMTQEFLRDRLFRPFETTKPEGVGLGLATASQIVRFHRGTIRILSQPGGGTLVRCAFPAAAEASP
ncbi:MAG TPA: ATP-binding protein [Thermoanaerobaculia bacterium]|nr:ATP-binding protein [Thermoanaerobaculia bacterium]